MDAGRRHMVSGSAPNDDCSKALAGWQQANELSMAQFQHGRWRGVQVLVSPTELTAWRGVQVHVSPAELAVWRRVQAHVFTTELSAWRGGQAHVFPTELAAWRGVQTHISPAELAAWRGVQAHVSPTELVAWRGTLNSENLLFYSKQQAYSFVSGGDITSNGKIASCRTHTEIGVLLKRSGHLFLAYKRRVLEIARARLAATVTGAQIRPCLRTALSYRYQFCF